MFEIFSLSLELDFLKPNKKSRLSRTVTWARQLVSPQAQPKLGRASPSRSRAREPASREIFENQQEIKSHEFDAVGRLPCTREMLFFAPASSFTVPHVDTSQCTLGAHKQSCHARTWMDVPPSLSPRRCPRRRSIEDRGPVRLYPIVRCGTSARESWMFMTHT